MKRHLIPALILLTVSVIAYFAIFYDDAAAPLPSPTGVVEGQGGAGAEIVPVETGGAMAAIDAGSRRAVTPSRGPLYDDPEIQAALCGFKGRVVNHLKVPVPDCGVRMYRGAMDSILPQKMDLFAEAQDFEPQYIAGEVRTAQDGTFKMTGVWPRGFYLMFAGLDTDAPTHQVITKTPSAGEIVDLGDVVLNDAGVIVGRVVDSDGNPLAGALVRAADIPGALAAFFPAERFDPEGALLIREENSPVSVLRMPPWVKGAFDSLPIPTTLTGSDGTFRLVGVMPGSNMLATTTRGFLSDVKASVQVRSGAEKDVGRIRLREGEELYAKVLDEKGDPIAGAEVVAGSTLSMVPVDLGRYLGETNAEGEIDGFGFSPGKVTVAARRSKEHAWVMAEPQSIISDVFVTLPTQFGFTVQVQNADGVPVEDARFRLLRGKQGNGAAEMFMLGFVEPVSLKNRLTKLEDGGWRITGLNKGPYTLLAEVKGLSSGSESIELEDKDGQCVIKLAPPTLFSVLVVNQDDAPIRNAAIFAEARGDGRMTGMPINCGRTGKDGRLQIDKMKGESIRVSAEHPGYGVVHGETKPNEELVLRLVEPGAIHGVLSENGEPPLPGKFTVAVMFRRSGGVRGPLETTPQMVTAGLDGKFTVTSLQPGSYYVTAMNSLDSIRSPGSIMDMATSMFVNPNFENERITVASGQAAEVRLEVGKEPLEGPTAQVAGTVMINGRVASGYSIVARSQTEGFGIVEGPGSDQFGATVDERGRFDLGIVKAGTLRLSIIGKDRGIFMGRGSSLWSDNIKLAEGEQRDLTIDIMTSVLAGQCYFPDGSPAGKVFVNARGKLKNGTGRKSGMSESDGSFRFKDVVEGVWTLDFEARDEDQRWRTKLENIEVVAGGATDSLRVNLVAALIVKGTVDLSVFEKKPRWSYLSFQFPESAQGELSEGRESFGVGVRRKGNFLCDELIPGSYKVRLYVDGKEGGLSCGVLDVPASGLSDVKLVPQLK
jgi:hypothetical protein